MREKPLILVCNDDGIVSKGIRFLVSIAETIGKVIVVAPDSPQSGMGHAITVGNTLRLYKNTIFGEDIEAYECSGTPVDCIKLGVHYILKDQVPDLVLSGVNHGPNSSISILYSGTMSAAMEGALQSIPSIGFSLNDYDHNANMEHCRDLLHKIIIETLQKGIPKDSTLNVNIPGENNAPIKGIKICRQAKAKWIEKFDVRHDPHNQKYFWMAGEFQNHDEGTDTDEWALANGYISIVPCQYDMTHYDGIPALQNSWEI